MPVSAPLLQAHPVLHSQGLFCISWAPIPVCPQPGKPSLALFDLLETKKPPGKRLFAARRAGSKSLRAPGTQHPGALPCPHGRDGPGEVPCEAPARLISPRVCWRIPGKPRGTVETG